MPIRTADAETRRRIAAAAARGLSKAAVAREVGVHVQTARRYWPADPLRYDPMAGPAPAAAAPALVAPRLPDPVPEAGGPAPPGLPDPVPLNFGPFAVDAPGDWGVLSDIHVPYHDRATIEAAVREWKSRGVVGVLLNGDVLDFHRLSDYVKEPSAARLQQEVEKGRQLLEWLRAQFPRARVVYKLGNHDERLKRYLATRAPELEDLDDLDLGRLLRVADVGVEVVGDKRPVMLGKLPVIHGHEYRGGGGVMPARWLFIRAWSNALLGHFHQPTYFPVRTLDGRELAVWSTGCACYLSPAYAPLNQWAHGWATVTVDSGGGFHVDNRRLLKDGRVA
jgi:predicted phosphodiesterase